MNGEIYTGVVIPAKDSGDGDTPTLYTVTQEANGYAIWHSSFEGGTVLVHYKLYESRDAVLEKAVGLVQRDRAVMKKAA